MVWSPRWETRRKTISSGSSPHACEFLSAPFYPKPTPTILAQPNSPASNGLFEKLEYFRSTFICVHPGTRPIADRQHPKFGHSVTQSPVATLQALCHSPFFSFFLHRSTTFSFVFLLLLLPPCVLYYVPYRYFIILLLLLLLLRYTHSHSCIHAGRTNNSNDSGLFRCHSQGAVGVVACTLIPPSSSSSFYFYIGINE